MPGRSVATTRSWTGGQYSFAQIPSVQIPRSVFNRSCGRRQTFNSGYLIPIFVDEALPGDTMSMRVTSFTRMGTPLFPVMDNIYQDFFFFAVPIRLVWENFEEFMGHRVDPALPPVARSVPRFVDVTVASESLSDYLGIPPNTGLEGSHTVGPLTFNSLWHRAYNLIFRDWFRSEDLQSPPVVDMDDGPDTLSDYVLLRRGKRHDYFTSCLPFTQKGNPVTLPLGTSAPILGDIVTSGVTPQWTKTGGSGTIGGESPLIAPVGTDPNVFFNDTVSTNSVQLGFGTVTGLSAAGLTADLSSATAATINAIREAFQVQKLLERDARGGTRYTEIVRAHFGVVSPDARLQRPEYLGGGSTRINMHPVAKTNTSTAAGGGTGPPIATLGAFATASGSVGWTKSFTEHTLLLGLVQVRADLTYQQGIERMFSRQLRYDFYWPEFAHLGEQAVLNQEIYAIGVDGTGATQDQGVFGYQERWAEYRYKPSTTAGKFRSQIATPLDQWHLGIEFAGSLPPALNGTFIQDNSPFARVEAVTSEPEFFGDFWFEYRCVRPMPVYSVPGFVDHF